MDTSGLRAKYSPILRKYALPLTLLALGLIFLVYGMIQYFAPYTSQKDLEQKKDKSDIIFEASSNLAVDETKVAESRIVGVKDSKQVVVDIEGAVEKPGVYKLATEARVQDVLIAAGGMSKDADMERVARGINLAGKIIDGGKIYIPFIGDVETGGSIEAGMLGVESKDLININSAGESELNNLPGVGPVTSQKIINNRPYGGIDGLVEKKVVGAKVFEQIKDKITAQ